MTDKSPDRATRVPAIMTIAQFRERFGNDTACRAHLKSVRWGENLERFVCPACSGRRGWWLPRRELVECCACQHQCSVTAGTVFHRLRMPLWKWFWAIYQVAHDKKGIAALELAKQLGVRYRTAWLMLHKLRRAMRHRNERYLLQGLVDVDETYAGGVAEGKRGRGAEHKIPVAVAVERQPRGPGRIALATLPRVDGHSLRRFASRTIAPGATLRTDGWSAYRSVIKAGFTHQPVPTRGGKVAVETFHWLHVFVGNLKRMLNGTYHHVASKHLDSYLSEFAYRANRRKTEPELFDHLLVAAIGCKASTYRELVTGVR